MNRLSLKSKRSKVSLLPALLLTLLSTVILSNQALAETDEHHQAYLEALDTVVSAESGIASEMARISDGTVAHFDFLQHQHIELLRHASALRHPPSRMAASKRDSVISKADALFLSAESLEIVIADFLRAQALLTSAVNNTLDLVATLPPQKLLSEDIKTLQQLAHAAEELRTHNTLKNREAADAAFNKIASLDIGQTWQKQLSVQQQLISDNVAAAAAGVSKLVAVDLTSAAKELQASYLAAMTD